MNIRATILAATVIAAAACATSPARARDFLNLGGDFVPDHAGMFEVRLRAVGVLPENRGSSVGVIGGTVHATNNAIPEADISYFLTDHLSLEEIAGVSRHEISASGTALGHVDVGSTWVLPPTLTLQFHFMPHARFDPYLGVGATVAFFFSTKPAGGAVTSLGLKNTVSPAFQAGFDYALGGHWVLNADVKQTLIQTTARIDGGTIQARTHLDPTLVGFGVGYRF